MITTFLSEIQAWYQQPIGLSVLKQEQQRLEKLWPEFSGEYLLALGLTDVVTTLTQKSRLLKHICLTPNLIANTNIVGNFTELPIANESIDIVFVHHWLGMLDEAAQSLKEIYRVLVPEGKIIVCGLAPARYWKYYHQIHHQQQFPHSLHSAPAGQVKKWLRDENFHVDKLIYHSHGLSLELWESKNSKFNHLLQPLSHIGFSGGAYVLVAQKKLVALTPLKIEWKNNWELAKGVTNFNLPPVNNTTNKKV